MGEAETDTTLTPRHEELAKVVAAILGAPEASSTVKFILFEREGLTDEEGTAVIRRASNINRDHNRRLASGEPSATAASKSRAGEGHDGYIYEPRGPSAEAVSKSGAGEAAGLALLLGGALSIGGRRVWPPLEGLGFVAGAFGMIASLTFILSPGTGADALLTATRKTAGWGFLLALWTLVVASEGSRVGETAAYAAIALLVVWVLSHAVPSLLQHLKRSKEQGGPR